MGGQGDVGFFHVEWITLNTTRLDRLCNDSKERIAHGGIFSLNFLYIFIKKKKDSIPFLICSPLGQAADPS